VKQIFEGKSGKLSRDESRQCALIQKTVAHDKGELEQTKKDIKEFLNAAVL
jgi:hypothetical protein